MNLRVLLFTLVAVSSFSFKASSAELTLFDVNLSVSATHQLLGSMKFVGVTDARNTLVSIKAYALGSIYPISVQNLRAGRAESITSSGFEIANIQGIGINTIGEGTLRVSLNSKIVASNLSPVMNFQIRRLGRLNKWVGLSDRGPISNAQLDFNKSPVGMSGFQLIFSPPQVQRISVHVLPCDQDQVLRSLTEFGDLSYAKALRCNLRSLNNDQAANLMASAVSALSGNAFQQIHFHQKDPKTAQTNAVKATESLASLGLKFPSTSATAAATSLFSASIHVGNLAMIDWLLTKGYKPDSTITNEVLARGIQLERSGRPVRSDLAKKIKEKLLPFMTSNINLSNLFHSFVSYNESAFENFYEDRARLRQIETDYYLEIVDYLVDLGWNVNQHVDNHGERLSPIQIAEMRASSLPESAPAMSAMIARLKALGATR